MEHKYSNRLKTIELLLRLGASLDSRDKRGLNPLDLAVINNELPIIEFLLKAGADFDRVHGNLGRWEAETALHLAVTKSSLETIKLLVHYGSDINRKDRRWETPAIKAAKAGRTDVVEFLKQLDADLTLRDVDDWGLLHWAAWCKHESTVRWLLEKAAANPNSRDRHGSTPLHIAAERGLGSIIRILIYYGADVKLINNKDQTPLDCINHSMNSNLIQLFTNSY